MAGNFHSIAVLLGCVRYGGTAQQAAALKALLGVVQERTRTHAALAAAGGIPLLVQRLHSTSQSVQRNACLVLTALASANRHLAAAIAAAGAVRTAADLLQQAASRSRARQSQWLDQVGRALLLMLSNVAAASSDLTAAVAAEAGAIMAAAQLLRAGQTGGTRERRHGMRLNSLQHAGAAAVCSQQCQSSAPSCAARSASGPTGLPTGRTASS